MKMNIQKRNYLDYLVIIMVLGARIMGRKLMFFERYCKIKLDFEDLKIILK
jgi:hypothetical protein